MEATLICSCGTPLSCKAGDCIQDGVYRWHLSCRCGHCGNAVEMDGSGMTEVPPEVQQNIMESYGTWELLAVRELSKVCYLIKRLLKTEVTESAACAFSGTEQQALWLKGKLLEKGISASSLEVRPQPAESKTAGTIDG